MSESEDEMDAVENSRLDRVVSGLMEHYDSVQIFVSRASRPGETEARTTVGITRGSGNLYARHGQVAEWMTMQRAYADQHARRPGLDEPE